MGELTMGKRMAALALLALAGCGGGGKTFVTIEVARGNLAGPVHRIALDFRLDGRPAMIELREPGDVEITLPTSTVVELASGSGELLIGGTAFDAGGAQIGHGSVYAQAERGGRARVVLSFGVEVPAGADGGPDGESAAARLAIEPGSKNFGDVGVGRSSAPASFTVRNSGGAATGALAVATSAPAFVVAPGGCAGVVLAPGESCSVDVSFAPAAEGPLSGELVVSGVRAPLDGNGLQVGSLVITPDQSDFGTLVLGSGSSPITFTVSNGESTPTGLITTHLGGTDSTQFAVVADSCAGNSLGGGMTCTITARFAPTAMGTKNASLTVGATPGGSAAASLVGVAQSPPNLSLSPTSYDFGNVVLPGPSATQTFTVRNSGGVAAAALAVTVLGSDAVHYALSADGCSGTPLAAGASCTVAVSLRPTTRGTKAATLRVTPMGQTALPCPLTGVAQEPAGLLAQPTALAFGNVLLGGSSSASVTVRNPGDVATGTLAATLGGGTFTLGSDGCSGAPLAAGASCTITVVFAPGSEGAQAGSLDLAASPGGPLAVALAGTGIRQGLLTISDATAFADTQVGQTSTVQTLTITNSGGTTSGPLTTALVGTDPADFSILSNGCVNATLAPQATCMVGLRFAPRSAGNKLAQLEVAGTPGGTVSAGLGGRGLAPALLSLGPALRDFGTVVVGSTPPQQVFTVSNDGGVATGALSVSLSGAQASDYQITANGCSGPLAAGAQCAVTVRFTPAAGVRAAALDVSASPGGSVSAPLSGTGVTPALLALSGALAFGTRLNGSDTTVDVTVTNSGQQPSGTLGAPSTSDGAQFAIVAPTSGTACTTATALAGGASCRFGVRFHPLSSGAKAATIGVAASPGGSPTLAASGTGQSAALLDLTPAAHGFGAVNLGSSATQTFTLSNGGEQSTGALVGPTSSDGNFAVVAPGSGTSCLGLASLAGGASCSFVVRFTPGAAGNHSGTITVSATPGNTDSATVSGTGQTSAALTVAPSSVNAGDIDVGMASTVVDVTLTNNGTQATGAIATPVPTHAAFTVVAPLAGPACTWNQALAGGASCRFGVRFAPTATGSATGSLGISASPGGSAVVSLAGVGQSAPLLELLPAVADFGTTYVDGGGNYLLTVRNTGTRTSGPLSFNSTGTYYAMLPIGGDCMSGQTLAGGASCALHVNFTSPQNVTDAMGSLMVSVPGSSDSSTLIADAIRKGGILNDIGTLDFQLLAVGQPSQARAVMYSNPGDEPVTAIEYTVSPSGEFTTVPGGTCTSTLAGGASCTQYYAVTPASGGNRTATLKAAGVSAGAGTTHVTVDAKAEGGYLVTVTRSPAQSTGYIDVFFGSGAPSCYPTSCTYLFPAGTGMVLIPQQQNGWRLSSWTSGPCNGSKGSCSFTLTSHVSANGDFCQNC